MRVVAAVAGIVEKFLPIDWAIFVMVTTEPERIVKPVERQTRRALGIRLFKKRTHAGPIDGTDDST